MTSCKLSDLDFVKCKLHCVFMINGSFLIVITPIYCTNHWSLFNLLTLSDELELFEGSIESCFCRLGSFIDPGPSFWKLHNLKRGEIVTAVSEAVMDNMISWVLSTLKL